MVGFGGANRNGHLRTSKGNGENCGEIGGIADDFGQKGLQFDLNE